MSTLWIDSPKKLEEFCKNIDHSILAIDTESDHFHAYQASVSLIQVAAGDTTALIDPLKIDAEAMQPFFELIKGPGYLKLLHSARNDIMELNRDFGIEIENIYDTQIAARFLGYERSSLEYLLEELLQIKPGPKFQRFDWTTRPLPSKALHYATEDVVHLERLKAIFDVELEKEGWSQAFRETCARIASTSNFQARPFDPEGWRRIKTRRPLEPRDRAALAALYTWRHQLCLELNQAALFVMDNASLLRIACARPTTPSDFKRLSIRKSLNRHRLESLLETIKSSLNVTPPPEKLRRQHDGERPSPEEQALQEALKTWRNRAADEYKIPREFIANNSTLAAIASNPPHELARLHDFEDILPWHREMFGAEIIETCRSSV